MSGKNQNRVAHEILEGLTELRDAVRDGKPLDQVFTVRTVDLVLSPELMDTEAIRVLRVCKLRASRAVFAAVLGVSVKLVEAWEQGKRTPKPWALRIMHIFNHDPALFYRQIALKEKQAC
jgi:DNA-binding transcriptional regulator YiaG